MNEAAQDIVDDILTTPGTTFTSWTHSSLGQIIDVVAPDGRGIRYSDAGNFIGFLEP
jgi:filamentous hemagglutinin